MLHVLRGGIPGPLILSAQLAALGAVFGLALAAVLRSAPALHVLVQTLLGVQEMDLGAWPLVKRLGAAGFLTGGVLWLTSMFTHTTVQTIPGVWILLGAFAVGVIVRFVSDRPVLVAGEDDLATADNAPAAMFVAGICGDALLLATGAAIAYRAYLPTLVAGASLGGALGVAWAFLRGPTLNLVRRTSDRPIGPSPGLGAVLVVGAGGGVLVSIAALAGGAQPAPWWFATSLVGFASLVLSVRRYAAPPPIAVSRRSIGGFETNALETQGRGPEHLPAILLLHGIFSNVDWWRPMMQWLARQVDCRIVAVAVPGVAPGVGPIRDGAVLPQLRQWVEDCVAELFPGEKPLLGAASLLGHPALSIAQDPDEPIAGAFVIGTMGMEISPVLRRLARAPIRSTILAATTIAPLQLRGRLLRVFYRSKETSSMGPWVAELLAGIMADPAESARVLRLVHRVAGEVLESRIDLAQIRVPVEFAWSRDDSISPVGNADRVTRLGSPRLRTTVYDEGGHSPYLVHPDRVGASVIEFGRFLRTTTAAADGAVGRPHASGPRRGARAVQWWWPPSWPQGSRR